MKKWFWVGTGAAALYLLSQDNEIGKIHSKKPPGKQMCLDGKYTDAYGRGACSYHGGVFMGENKRKSKAKTKTKLGESAFLTNETIPHNELVTLNTPVRFELPKNNRYKIPAFVNGMTQETKDLYDKTIEKSSYSYRSIESKKELHDMYLLFQNVASAIKLFFESNTNIIGQYKVGIRFGFENMPYIDIHYNPIPTDTNFSFRTSSTALHAQIDKYKKDYALEAASVPRGLRKFSKYKESNLVEFYNKAVKRITDYIPKVFDYSIEWENNQTKIQQQQQRWEAEITEQRKKRQDEKAKAAQIREDEFNAIRANLDLLPIVVKLDDIPFNVAQRAYEGTSQVPQKRAKSEQQNNIDTIIRIYLNLKPYAKTANQKTVLRHELDRLYKGMVQRNLDLLATRSGLLSQLLVTGRGGWTGRMVRSQERKQQTFQNKLNEYLSYLERAEKAIKRKLEGAKPSDQIANEEVLRLKKVVDGGVATLLDIENGGWGDKNLFKSSVYNKIKTSAKNGNIEAVKEALRHLKEMQAKYLKKPAFTDAHKIWKVLEEDFVVKATKEGIEPMFKGEGYKVIKNFDEDRIQILFDEKPSAELRKQLNSSGWNWSRRNTAWQRKITANAEYSAKTILEAKINGLENDSFIEKLALYSFLGAVAYKAIKR